MGSMLGESYLGFKSGIYTLQMVSVAVNLKKLIFKINIFMKQNKLLYNIVKIANEEEYKYYDDLPRVVQEVMARQAGEQDAKKYIQHDLRSERLAQYVRDHKMSPQEAAKRYNAAYKSIYKVDPNYYDAGGGTHWEERNKGYQSVMSAYEKNKEKKLKMKALGK